MGPVSLGKARPVWLDLGKGLFGYLARLAQASKKGWVSAETLVQDLDSVERVSACKKEEHGSLRNS